MQKASAFLGRNQDKIVAGKISALAGTTGTVMHAIALNFFGTDIYDWEPETIAMEFKEEFGVDPDEDNLQKLFAILSSVSSDSFYKDWVSYIKVCSVLSGENTVEDLLEITVEELAWGVLEMSLNDEDFDKSLFSSDIAVLTGIVLDENGYVKPPPQLSFAKLPSRYMGSTTGPDQKNEVRNSDYNTGLLSQYLHDQVLTLYKQIKALPWLDNNDFNLVIREASRLFDEARRETSPLKFVAS